MYTGGKSQDVLRAVLFGGLLLWSASGACAAQDGAFTLWAVDDLTRIDAETGKAFEDNPKQLPGGLSGDYRHRNAVWSSAENTVRLRAARNEVAAFQAIIEGAGTGFTVTCSPLAGPGGNVIPLANIQCFREWYIFVPQQKPLKGSSTPLAEGWYPDPAVPLEGKLGNGFAIPSPDFHDAAGTKVIQQKNQAIWVDVHVPMAAVPGEYTGALTVKNAAGNSQELKIAVTVWPFAIPAETHMIAHLVNYGETTRETPEMMRAYYCLAYEHRAVINDDTTPPVDYNGKDFEWKGFDEKFGPFFDGTAFTKGPTAGVPIPHWILPVNFRITRPDKGGKTTGKDWPVSATKTPTGYGVVFDDALRQKLLTCLRQWQEHFTAKGWTKTKTLVFQNEFDEPGFFFDKPSEKQKAGIEQAEGIYNSAKLVKDSKLPQMTYRFDIGSGFADNQLDLDGNGKMEGAMDVAKRFSSVIGLWYIHGLCMEKKAVEHILQDGNTVCFYNGFEPHVAPNALNGELLGFRQWALAAYRCKLAGWVDWEFRFDSDIGKDKKTVKRKVFYETQGEIQRNMYLYRGEDVGVPGVVWASIRMKAVRRGAQDFEMLRLLALKDGNDTRAQELAARVCSQSFWVQIDTHGIKDDDVRDQTAHSEANKFKGLWAHDPAVWAKFHDDLGAALAK